MNRSDAPLNTLPIRIASEIRRDGDVQFVVRVGETDETRMGRYFEVRLPDDSHVVRAEWDKTRARGAQGFAFRLFVDEMQPRELIYRDGDLFEPGISEPASARADSFVNEPAVQEALRRFWVFTEAGIDTARQIAREPSTDSTRADTVLSEWAGCEADFAGAGAGVGAAVGAVAGGPKGMAAGAGVGGVIGAAFGLGYCTAAAVCG